MYNTEETIAGLRAQLAIANQHVADLTPLVDELARLRAENKALGEQRENMCVFITRLCRQCYKLGLRNKLTDSAMDYINKTDAVNTPTTKLLRKIFPEAHLAQSGSPGAGKEGA